MVLDERAHRAERTIGSYRKRGHAAAAVVRHENTLAGPIHREVTGALTAGVLLVQQRQLSCCRVDGERADRAVGRAFKSAAFTDRVEKAMVGMDGEEGGIDCFRRDSERSQRAGGGIEAAHVDAFALRGRAGSDVDEAFAMVSRRRGGVEAKGDSGK